MKKLLLLFVSFLFATLAVSAQSKPDVSKFMPDFIKFDKARSGDAYFTIDRVLTTSYEDKITQNWVNNAWVNVDRSIDQWDTNTGTIESVSMVWDTLSGDWINEMKMFVTFAQNLTDSTLRFLTLDMYMWDNSAWVLFVNSVYTYDSNNFLVEINSSVNLGGTIMPYIRVVYTNNSVGYPLTEVEENVNFATLLFENEEMHIYTYQGGNPKYLTNDLQSEWNGSAWIDTSKTNYTRNSKLKPTVEIESDIYGGATVLDANKTESVYLAGDDLLSSEIRYWWNTAGTRWDIGGRNTYTYTTFNKLDVMLMENYMSGAYVPWLRTTHTYDGMEREILEQTEIYVAKGFEIYSRTTTAYTPSAVGDESPILNGFVLEQNYPNPFNP
ncbi:MAG: hypothetical protein K8H86_15840, partial [Ignavibacteriaceae bacterium]|nr:hypothetical protein [Ignavibacteriaceae bacterium]